MRIFFRYFFRTLRTILGPFVLLWEALSTPKAVVRSAEEQAQVDAQSAQLALYQFRTCPFCIKVRREMNRLGLKIELRDAQQAGPHRDELIRGGGSAQVPCLRISEDNGGVRWLYESAEIIGYLQQRFAPQNA